MKKEVLLVTILTIIVSLSAVVYAAALTNPGQGVEEVGSGSSPYAPFRDWNALESGYEDQYSGPSGLKSNVFWLATANAETIAAQNSSGDWCAIQVHPSGVYINCFNNASNMSLFQGYYWNGTNFTKNDTIKEGNNAVERNIITAGPTGSEQTTEFTNPITGGSTSTTTNPSGSTITATNGAGTTVSTTTITPLVIALTNLDVGTSTVEVDGGAGVTTTADDGAGGIGTSTTTPTGTSIGTTSGGIPVGGGLTTTPTAGTDIFNYDTAGGGTIFSQFSLFENANGGTSDLELTSIGGIQVFNEEALVDGAGSGIKTTTAYGPVAADFITAILTGQDVVTTDPALEIVLQDGGSGANFFTITGNGDNAGAGVGGLTALDAAGNPYSFEADGTTSTATVTASATSIEVDGAGDDVTMTAGTVEKVLGAVTTNFITCDPNEVLWADGIEFKCPNNPTTNDFGIVTTQNAPIGTILLTGGVGSGCWTITTTVPGGAGSWICCEFAND